MKNKWPEKKSDDPRDYETLEDDYAAQGRNGAIDEGRAAVLEAVSVERLSDLIKMQIDLRKKPSTVFMRKLMPSDGVESLYKQDEEIRKIATAIRKSILTDLGIKEEDQ